MTARYRARHSARFSFSVIRPGNPVARNAVSKPLCVVIRLLVTDESVLLAQALNDPSVGQAVTAMTGSEPAKEGLGLLADVIRGRRARVQLKVLERAVKAIDEADLPIEVVPAKTLVPLLEFAGLEEGDDEDMVTRWANLLANAATPSADEVMPAYPDILRQLVPIEARVLDSLVAQEGWALPFDDERTFAKLHGRDIAFARVHVDNLLRLGLINTDPTQRFAQRDPLDALPHDDHRRVAATDLGAAFVAVCRPPRGTSHFRPPEC
jgi:hypothetical protein